jgi:predicted RNase H-like nuclease (RuvC/YqgF family)
MAKNELTPREPLTRCVYKLRAKADEMEEAATNPRPEIREVYLREGADLLRETAADVEARDQALQQENAELRQSVEQLVDDVRAVNDTNVELAKRDQAREAEIRALILDAKLVRHNEPGAVIQHPGFMPECPFCIRDLDSLLTPASQEGQTR